MIKVPDPSELADFNLADYFTEPLEKYIDNRGFIYLLYDSVYPDHIKIGRTGNCKKRLIGYNSDKPFPTAKILYISDLFTDVNEIERKILHYMYANTSSTTLSREWFMIEHKQMLIDIISKAEQVSLNEFEV